MLDSYAHNTHTHTHTHAHIHKQGTGVWEFHWRGSAAPPRDLVGACDRKELILRESAGRPLGISTLRELRCDNADEEEQRRINFSGM